MSEKVENQEEEFDESVSEKHFDKVVKASLLIGIIFVSCFIVYYILEPEPGFVNIGILNEDKKAEDYPVNVTANDIIEFYVTVGNYLPEEFTFELKIKKGDNDTVLSSSGSKHTSTNFTTDEKTLKSGKEWTSDKLTISYYKVGSGQLLIVELWEIINDNEKEFYDILFLRLNITA